MMLFLNSCKMPNEPLGFMGGKDITPPVLQICSPVHNATVKGIVQIKLLVKDLFGVKEVAFKDAQGNRVYLYPTQTIGDTLIYTVNLAMHSGNYHLGIEAIDEGENVSTAQLNLNVIPLMKSEFNNNGHSLTVYDIEMDGNGNLWFGAFEGLLKYNGVSFSSSVPGFDLPRPYVSSIAIDKHNTLWMKYGQRYNSESPRLIEFNGSSIINNYYFPQIYPYSFRYLAVDNSDSVWGAGSDALFKFKDGNYSITYAEINKHFFYMTNDKNYRVWLKTTDGIQIFENNEWRLITPTYPIVNDFFVIDDSLNLWAKQSGRPYAIVKYDGVSWYSYDLVSSSIEIRAFDVDRDGNLWVMSDSYLEKFNSNGVLIKRICNLSDCHYLKVDSQNNIWLCTTWNIYRLNENGL